MPKTINENDLIARAKQNFKTSYELFQDMYDEMVEDLEFSQGIGQWPRDIEIARTNDKRPCLKINKLPQFCDKVVGDMRQARPRIKIRPVDDDADKDTADILTGLIKNIETQSDGEIVYDSGAEAQVRCGYGAWRVGKKYISDDSFDQRITIDRVKNQFAVLFDPAAKNFDRSDGRFAFVYEDMPRTTFKRRFPNNKPEAFSGGGDDLSAWCTEETVRVAEYFERDTTTHTIYLIKDANDRKRVVEKLPDEPHEVLRQRQVQSQKITWYRISGTEILEGPIELDGSLIPLVPVYGKEVVIKGQSHYSGIVRHSKDSQRLYNYYRSMDAETIALAPKAPWIMTKTMLGPYKKFWLEANNRNFSYLLFEPDPKLPGVAPQRNVPQMANQAIMQQVMVADQELHDTTGLQLASLGKKSNEQSGRAIEARAKEGDIGQYTYTDNLARAIKLTAKIIIDMIPSVYDTPRVERIIGEDNTGKNVQINETFQENGVDKIFDLTIGKYDVVVDVGPSYQTQRQESLSAMIEFARILDPPQRQVISDKIASTSDWHGSDIIAGRLKKTIPPEYISDEEKEDEEPQQPTEQELKAQAMQERMQEIQIEEAEVKLETEKAKMKKSEADAAKAEADAAVAEAEAMVKTNNPKAA